MPITFWTFLIGGFALSGFPLVTSGFWSKDEILADAFGHGHWVVFITLALAALLTAFYTMRQITLTFLGEPRTKEADHAHETPWTMTVPLMVLGFFSIAFGWTGIPEKFPVIGGFFPNWFHDYVGESLVEHPEAVSFSWVPLLTSLVVAIGGLTLGWMIYRKMKAGDRDPVEKALGPVYTVLKNKYYFDELYEFLFIRPAQWLADRFAYRWMDLQVIDGVLHWFAYIAAPIGNFFRDAIDKPIVNGFGDWLAETAKKLGSSLRPVQTGKIQQYMILALVSVAAFSALFYYLLVFVR